MTTSYDINTLTLAETPAVLVGMDSTQILALWKEALDLRNGLPYGLHAARCDELGAMIELMVAPLTAAETEEQAAKAVADAAAKAVADAAREAAAQAIITEQAHPTYAWTPAGLRFAFEQAATAFYASTNANRQDTRAALELVMDTADAP